MRIFTTVLLTSSLFLPAALSAQNEPATATQTAVTEAPFPYEIISTVKPNKSNSGNVDISINDNLVIATNVNIKLLLENAFHVRQGLISGLPSWANATSYDINAKIMAPSKEAIEKLTDEQYQQVITNILVEHFHLKTHYESKVMPTYNLVVLPTGAKLHLTPIPAPSPENPQPHKPGSSASMSLHNNRRMDAKDVLMPRLAYSLSNLVNRTVIDKTGLTGEYDFTLNWTPDDVTRTDNGADQSLPSLFTAIQEQLGLKLVPSHEGVKALVVDQLDPPTED